MALTALDKAKEAISRIQSGEFSLVSDEVEIIRKAMDEHPEISYLLPFKSDKDFERFAHLYYIVGYTKALSVIFYQEQYQTKEFLQYVDYFKEKSKIVDVGQLGFNQRELDVIFEKAYRTLSNSMDSDVKEVVGIDSLFSETSIDSDYQSDQPRKETSFAIKYYSKMLTDLNPFPAYESLMQEMSKQSLTFEDIGISEAEFGVALNETFERYATELYASGKELPEQQQEAIAEEINKAYKTAGIKVEVTKASFDLGLNDPSLHNSEAILEESNNESNDETFVEPTPEKKSSPVKLGLVSNNSEPISNEDFTDLQLDSLLEDSKDPVDLLDITPSKD